MTNNFSTQINSSNKFIFLISLPLIFLIANGVIVIALKTFELNASIYFPLIFLAMPLSLLASRWLCSGSINWSMKDIIYFIVPAIVASVHLKLYGTTLGSDGLSYFTYPVQAFFNSDTFTHAEKPFVEFGNQPIATYWLHNNAEYLATGLGKLLNFNALQIFASLHFLTLFLFVLIIYLMLDHWVQPLAALLFLLSFILLLYGLSDHIRTLGATSLFRGYENKGLIWGFYLFIIIAISLGICAQIQSFKKLFAFGFITGLSAMLVSGNAVFLALPALSLLAAQAFLPHRRQYFLFLAGLFVSMALSITLLKVLEVTNVYDVVDADLTFRTPPTYLVQSEWLARPLWLWGLAGFLAVTATIVNWRWGAGQLIILLLALCIRSELFYDVFFQLAPEFTLNFWRPIIMIEPTLVVFVSMIIITANIRQSRQIMISGISLCVVVGLFLASIIQFPAKSPFGRGIESPQLSGLKGLCPDGSIVLTDRWLGTRLPVLQPQYEYLVGKEYFLNWQIANLSDQIQDRERALHVRNAGLFLSKDPVTGQYGTDVDGFAEAINSEMPQLVLMRSNRVTPEIDQILSDYYKQTANWLIVYSRAECKKDYAIRVKNSKQGLKVQP